MTAPVLTTPERAAAGGRLPFTVIDQAIHLLDTLDAVTLDGRLHLSFRYRRRPLGDEAACRFADRVVAELVALAERA